MKLLDKNKKLVFEVKYEDKKYSILSCDKEYKGIVLIDGGMMVVHHDVYNVIDVRTDCIAFINADKKPNLSNNGWEKGYTFKND